MNKLWEKFRGHKTEILLVGIALVTRLSDAFPNWEYWKLLEDILTILAGGTMGARVVRQIKNGNGKAKPETPTPPNAD